MKQNFVSMKVFLSHNLFSVISYWNSVCPHKTSKPVVYMPVLWVVLYITHYHRNTTKTEKKTWGMHTKVCKQNYMGCYCPLCSRGTQDFSVKAITSSEVWSEVCCWSERIRRVASLFQKSCAFGIHTETAFKMYSLWDPVLKVIVFKLLKRQIHMDKTPIR